MVQVWAMLVAGVVTLVVGLVLARPRLRRTAGAAKVLVLGPVFEATALAVFAAEHFFLADDLAKIVPKPFPAPLFWTYLVGLALVAAATSLIARRFVRWSATLLAVLFVIFVVTMDLPELGEHARERLFWTLTVRESSFAAGAIVLAASVWPKTQTRIVLRSIGRIVIAATLVFYAIQHVLFPRFVPGVPLEKMTPGWFPGAIPIAIFIGLIELAAAPLLLVRRTTRLAAAAAGLVLVGLTLFFYVPILVVDIHTERAIEGINYVFDTLLFAATILLAGLGDDEVTDPAPSP